MRKLIIVCLLFLLVPAMCLSALAAPVQDVGVTRSPTVTLPAKPLTSRVQLDAYLRDTPAADSPLSWLTPASRQRFLDSLAYTERGLGGMSLADLRYELTREQAYVLLQLFGAQDYALGLDALSMPRAAAEKPASSVLESAYDRLLAAESADGSSAGQLQAITRSYTEDFAAAQAGEPWPALGDHDITLLFRAAALAFGVTHQPNYLADMRRDFAELQRRHQVDRPHASDLYDALLTAHHADEARALLATYPSIERNPPPLMRAFNRIRPGQPSLWIIAPNSHKRELLRLRFNLRVASQVVVLASTGCHFSAEAARDIEADPQLRILFREYGQWVAPVNEVTAFDAVRAWNQAYPELQLGIAYDNAALPMVKRVETPVFYFLDHGAVVDIVVGWPPGGNLDAIRRGLRTIKLLR